MVRFRAGPFFLAERVHRPHACTSLARSCCHAGEMAAEHPDTWRSRLSGSADRRGIPLGTIVAAAAVTIGLLDLNVGLLSVSGCSGKSSSTPSWPSSSPSCSRRPPASQTSRISHGVAVTLVFLTRPGGGGRTGVPVRLAPGHQRCALRPPDSRTSSSNTRKGRGPLGRLVFRLHLQKYLSKGSSEITKQLTKVLKPATAFSVGAAAISTLITVGTIAVLTFFAMLEAPTAVARLPQPVQPTNGLAPEPGHQ